MKNRIKINIHDVVFEVEGEKSFVQSVYQEWKEQIDIKSLLSSGIVSTENGDRNESQSDNHRKKKRATSKGKGKKTEDLQFKKDLDVEGLYALYEAKEPSNNHERNLVFVYYLTEAKGMQVSVDDVYSCYRHLVQSFSEIKIPTSMKNSLFVTGHKGWLNTSDVDNIKVTSAGLNEIEKMPRRSSNKE